MKWSESHLAMSSLQPHGLYSPWNSPGQNTGVGSLSILQGFFPTQGSNPDLLYCRQILYQLNHQGSPRILEWVACPFSRWSSQHRNWTRLSCTAGRFFTNWAVREARGAEQLNKLRSQTDGAEMRTQALGLQRPHFNQKKQCHLKSQYFL